MAEHGWLAVYKPLHVGSTDVVRLVRRAFKTRKVGHAGTLDPLATGVLPIAIGEATKTVPYAMDHLKTYFFTVRWGEERATDDREGPVVSHSDSRPAHADILRILPDFIGTISQTPPAYSAIRINGERAYNLARRGAAYEIAPRTVYIHNLKCTDVLSKDEFSFEMTCGKGVYVRSIARDMGRLLGCYGHVSKLHRTQSASFCESETISLEKLEDFVHKEGVFAPLHAVSRGLADILALRVHAEQALALKSGQCTTVAADSKHTTAWAYVDDETPIAIGKIEGTIFTPKRVFNI